MPIVNAMSLAQLQTTEHFLAEMQDSGVSIADALSMVSAEKSARHALAEQQVPRQDDPKPCPKCGELWSEVNGRTVPAYTVKRIESGVIIQGCHACRWSALLDNEAAE